ncbi:MAG TPA: 50S ribosomal protein L37ae [Candidatus Nanoarchaeia archaeon]|nr:50S ribosomal protein L37ae [Candidatus Nanoarchaeia archaeon]
MANDKKNGTGKRYGVRYGRTLREKASAAEKESRSRQVCPFCSKAAVKRLSLGIWHCSKCKNKFTGAAYAIKRDAKVEVSQ